MHLESSDSLCLCTALLVAGVWQRGSCDLASQDCRWEWDLFSCIDPENIHKMHAWYLWPESPHQDHRPAEACSRKCESAFCDLQGRVLCGLPRLETSELFSRA